MMLSTAMQQRFRLRIVQQMVDIAACLRPAGGDLVLFIHGLGCAKECFADVVGVPRLSDFSTCSLDLPGHGSSGRLAGGAYSLDAYADVVAEIVRIMDPDRVHLVGHSMGGAVGLLARERIGGRIHSVISIEGNLVAQDCGLVSRRAAERPVDQFVKDDFMQFRSSLSRSPRADLRRWGTWYAACDPVAIHAISRSLVEWSDSGKLVDIFQRSPNAMYVHGTDSGDLRYLDSVLAGMAVRSVPGSGHFPMLDRPDEFWRIIANAVTATAAAPEPVARLPLA